MDAALERGDVATAQAAWREAYAAAHAWAQPLEPDSHNRATSQLYSTLRDLGIAARGLARYQTAGAAPDTASRDFGRHVTASARWLLSACESLDGVLAAESSIRPIRNCGTNLLIVMVSFLDAEIDSLVPLWLLSTAGTMTNCLSRPWQILSVGCKVSATILLPAGFAGFRAERLFLTKGTSIDAAGRNAGCDQSVLHGGGALISQREVVLGGAAFIAMSLHQHS